MNVKLIVTYLGTPFFGWQKTNMGPSIEQALEEAISQILQEPVALQAASRTDRGVHATGQVVNFVTTRHIHSLATLQRSINALLPPSIAILEASQASDTFHPTLDCLAKEYHYFICFGPVQSPFYRQISWHTRFSLSLEKMQAASGALLGTHDFTALCNDPLHMLRNPICHISALRLDIVGPHRLRIAITGDRFLYKMVRNICGTLAYIGCGKIAPDTLPQILSSKERKLAGITAPAHGLFLHRVFYP